MSLAVYNGELIAAGEFTLPGSADTMRLARYDGVNWSPLAAVDSTVYQIGVFQNELYIFGRFANVDGVPANGMARWDGRNWRAVDQSGLPDPELRKSIYEISEVSGGLVISGGYLKSVDGGWTLGPVLSRWDGVKWDGLGSGPNDGSYLYALSNFEGKLCVGGFFGTMGGKAASYFSIWSPDKCCQGTRGNVTASGTIDLSDLSALTAYLTSSINDLVCLSAGDVNGSGQIDLSDLSSLTNYLTGGNYVPPTCP